ncbi:ABC transporter ATP-binding protein [Enterococcus ureilyticus]|uniref:ABC transporter ATP-binding protein n=1 Tax=Enterococcus ureilyticus TaxID=1131292 RepID=UPI001A937FA0|nr:ABC transporter ATP-binding protein [Enterococcus ureilyticus]MBO0445274.1 ABC transporter ATP-binding protein [Enterococcus ureilyticus]
MITVTKLTKIMNKKTILNKVSLTVNKGEIIALVGPNGAGKTTLINCLTGLIRPTAGEISLFGTNPLNKKNKMKLGVMQQESTTLENVKVKELLTLFRSFYPDPLSLEALLEITGLNEHQNTYTTKLSGGQKRRLTFGLSIIGKPELLFLDEPTTGMDVTSRQLFWEKINQLKEQGKTIILTTHYLEEIEKVATRILLMKQGEIVHDGTLESIQSEMLQNKLSFQLLDKHAEVKLADLPYVSTVEKVENNITLYSSNSDETLIELFATEIKFKNLLIIPGNLERVFNTLVAGENK